MNPAKQSFVGGLIQILPTGVCTLAVGLLLVLPGFALPQQPEVSNQSEISKNLVVDCLLPGVIRRLGRQVYVGPREPIKTTAYDCAIRGGEFTAYDRSNFETARAIWLEKAERGDAVAQFNLGEIYARGLGIEPDYITAVKWYERSAGQSYAPAQVSLADLYENGIGVPLDKDKALDLYRRATGLSSIQIAADVTAVAEPAGGQQVQNYSNGTKDLDVDFGNYHAFVIGNENYEHLPQLDTAHSDVRAIGHLLETKYGFDVSMLLDATADHTLHALDGLRRSLTEEDNLLIVYSGHSEVYGTDGDVYWLPVDAQIDDPSGWISSRALTDIFNVMSARKILVIADSAFAHNTDRAAFVQPGKSEAERRAYYRWAERSKARTVFTSGGLAPVFDGDGGTVHSLFAAALIEALESNSDAILESQRLFAEVTQNVASSASAQGFVQIPQYSKISFSADEGGDFFFVPSN